MIRAFFRNASILAAAEVIARLKGLVIIPLLTHRFHAVGYGVWAQVGVMVALFAPLIMIGTDAGVVRYLPGTDRAARTRQFAGWLVAVLAAAIVVCALVAALRHPLAVVAFGQAGEYARYVPLAAASILTTIVLNLARTWFRLENDARALSAITLAQAFLSTVALVAMYALHKGLYTLVLLTIAADALLGVVTVLLVLRRTGVVSPDFSLLPRLVRYGAVLLPAGYAIWALNWADRVILVRFADLRAVGLYSLAYSLGYLVIQVFVNPIWSMFPNVAAAEWNSGRRDAVQRLFETTAGVMLAVVLPVVAGGAVLGSALLRILAPADFGHAGPVLPLVLGGYLCFMLAAFYEVVFGLVDRQVLGLVTVLVACAVNIGLNLALIPPYSYTGAAIATTAAFAFQLALAIGLSSRLGLLRTRWALPLRVCAASTLMALALVPFRGAIADHGALGLLAGCAAGACVYGLLCWLLRVVDPAVARSEAARLFRRSAGEAGAEAPMV